MSNSPVSLLLSTFSPPNGGAGGRRSCGAAVCHTYTRISPSTISLKRTRHVLKGQKPEAQGQRSAALGKRPYIIRPCKGRRNQTSFRKLLPIHQLPPMVRRGKANSAMGGMNRCLPYVHMYIPIHQLPQTNTPSAESASHAFAQDNVWESKTDKRRPG